MADLDKSIEIRIVTKAELEGARAFEQQLEREIGKLKAVGQVTDELRQKSQQLEQVRRNISSSPLTGGGAASTAGGGDLLGGVGRSVGNYAAGLIGLQQALSFLQSAYEAAGKAREAQVGFNAALVGTSQYTPQLSAELQNLAKNLQDLTTIDSKQFLAGFGEALQRGIAPDQLEEVSKAALVLSERTGQTLPQAFNTLARVQQGNFQLLTRQGLAYKETGDRAKDYAEVLKILSSGFDLQSTKLREQQSQWAKLASQLEPLSEGVGSVLNKLIALDTKYNPVTLGWIAVGKAIDGTAEATNEMREAAERVDPRLKDLGTKAEDDAEALKKMADAAKAAATGYDELAESILKVRVARIDEAEARGQVSKEEADIMRKVEVLNAQEAELRKRAAEAETAMAAALQSKDPNAIAAAQLQGAQLGVDAVGLTTQRNALNVGLGRLAYRSAITNPDLTIDFRDISEDQFANAYADRLRPDDRASRARFLTGQNLTREAQRLGGGQENFRRVTELFNSDADYAERFRINPDSIGAAGGQANAALERFGVRAVTAFEKLAQVADKLDKRLSNVEAQNRNNPTRQ